jgi:DNA gyrase inhibitor GyrI
MVIEFAFRKAPSYRVAYRMVNGPWNEAKMRAGFHAVSAWAEKNGIATGRWVIQGGSRGGHLVGIEAGGDAKASGGIRVRTLPASRVAFVVFDPDVVSPEVIYHGLMDWLRWRKKDGRIRRVVTSREVYEGDPWTDPKAGARAEVQFVVRP